MMRPLIWILLLVLCCLPSADGQQYGCRTSGLSGQVISSYCASEAYVSRHFPTSSVAGHAAVYADASGQVLSDGGALGSSIDAGGGTSITNGTSGCLLYDNAGTVGCTGGTNRQTTNYQIQASDCNLTVQVNGTTGGRTLTLPASTSGFPEGCIVRFQNINSARAEKLVNFPSGMTSQSWLWPLQAGAVQVVGSTWTTLVNPGLWNVPINTVVYANINNGNDAFDCLDSNTTDGACQTPSQVLRVNAHNYFSVNGSTAFPTANLVLQLADNASGGNCTSACYPLTDIAFTLRGAEGRNALLIQGNASNPQNVVLADSGGYGFNIFRNSVEIQNLQFGQTNCAATPKANSGLSILEGGTVFLQGTVYFGCVNTSQIQITGGGYLDSNGRPINVVAGGEWMLNIDSGTAKLSGQSGASTVTFSNSPTYSQQVFSGVRGFFIEAGATYVNGGTVTSTSGKLNCQAGWIETDGVTLPGSGSTTPGSGCTVF